MDDVIETLSQVETLDIAQLLIAQSPGVLEQCRADGWSALHLAAFYGRAESVRVLLRVGASHALVSTNATANTPLHAAIAGSDDEPTISALLHGGADVNAVGGHDVTPLHLAASRDNRRLCETLIKLGADPRARTDDGSMPHHVAADRGHEKLAMWLEGVAAP